MKSPIVIFTFLTFIAFFSTQAQTIEIPLKKEYWTFSKGAEYRFETFDGRPTLYFNGRAALQNQEFSTGILEVEVYGDTKRSFAGITFRRQGETMDEVYLRMHKSQQVDAVQYTPIYNGESNWQLYKELQSKASIKENEWNRLKIEVQATSATIYLNEKELFKVNALRSENATGGLGLFALFGSRFANFKVTKKTPGTLTAIEAPKPAPDIITEWQLSNAKAFSAEQDLSFKELSRQKFRKVKTEPSGLLPISKFTVKPSKGGFEKNPEDYVVLKLDIDSEEVKSKIFSFDYSDRILVYFNGKEVFRGNNAFRSKGLQFQGHLDMNANTLILPLENGKNTLYCVLIEKANGWGIMGRLN